MQRIICCSTALVLVVLAVSALDAQETQKPEIETVLDGLKNPCGVAVQPGTGHIFVSDCGAARIVRITPDGHEAVITDFPLDVYGKGTYEQQTKFDIGPLGLAFLDKETLVVGGGGLPDGEELVRVYTVPEPGKSIKADAMKYQLGPIAPGDDSEMGEGNFFGVAVSNKGDAIFVTCNGDDAKGWVAKADVSDGVPSKLTPYIKTKELTTVDAPGGATFSKEGYLVVTQIGEVTAPGDSLLTFYDPTSGELLLNLKTGLHDLVGAAYHPKSGLLYGVDFAWGENGADGGLFRLDATKDNTVKAVEITKLDKPAAVAFGPDGSLYVAVFGSPQAGSDKAPGSLIRVTGLR